MRSISLFVVLTLFSSVLSFSHPLQPVDGRINIWSQRWLEFTRHAKAERKPDLVAVYADAFGDGVSLLRLKKAGEKYILYLSLVPHSMEPGATLNKVNLLELDCVAPNEFAELLILVMHRELVKTSYSDQKEDGHWTDGTLVVVGGYSSKLNKFLMGSFHYPSNPSLIWIYEVVVEIRKAMEATDADGRQKHLVVASQILSLKQ